MIGVFDFDGVLWSAEDPSGILFYDFLSEKGLVNHDYELRYYKYDGRIPYPQLVENFTNNCCQGLRGASVKSVRKAANEFMKQHKRDIYMPVIDVARELQEEGYMIAIISATFQELLDAFPYPFDKKFGTSFEKNGKYYTGNVIRTFYSGKNKAELFMEIYPGQNKNLPLKDSFAFGDSFHDKEMLEISQYPTAVNPHPDFKNYAEQNKIPIFKVC